MDRLFGKELSNLLNPFTSNNSINPIKIPSRSSREADAVQKKVQKKHEARSSSVVNEKKQGSVHDSLENRQKAQVDRSQDVQLVPEYFDVCLNFMLQQESKNYNIANYFEDQPSINEKMRRILLDWIAELHYKFKMFPQTLFATTMMLDIYLSKRLIKKENLQLVGAAAFFTAAKYQETYQIPEVDDLVHFAAKAFTKQQLIKMEAQIVEALEFNLIMTTSYRFFDALAKISGMDIKNFYLAQYVLQLSLLDIKFVEYKPSVLASSAIYLINKIRKRSESWSDLLIAATGYEEKDLKACARQLCYLLERSDELPNTKSLKRKFSSSQYHEVTRIKLERKKP